jgi:hypothetical protein
MSLPKDPIQAEEYKKKLSASLTGRKFSDAHIQHLKDVRLRNPAKFCLNKKRYRPYNPDEYLKNKEQHLERQRRYRGGKNREEYLRKARERGKIYNNEHRDEARERNKKNWLLRIEKFEKIAGRPKPNNCEICGREYVIVFDHDHITGNFRGWICDRCNKVLGLAEDDKNILNKLISYLDSFN